MSIIEDQGLKDLLKRCYLSTKISSRVFFPERFTRQFTPDHDLIFDLLDDDSKQKVAIAAPRGFGKSTTVDLAYPAKKILFQEKKYVITVSNTSDLAVERAEDLKIEITSNPTITGLFGPMESNNFSMKGWVTSTGIKVLPRGAGQQVRGRLHLGHRPDLIIVDDLEDSESVRSEEQRKKLKEWFFSDLVNSVDRAKNDWKIVVIGTILHEDSLLMNLLDDPDWHSVRLQLCDDNYNSRWPSFMSTDEVKALAESYAEKGLLHLFFMEYMNSIHPADAPFQQRYFKYYDPRDIDFDSRQFETVVIVDPAKTTNISSAFSAIVCASVDLQKNAIYFRDCINERLHPEQIYEAAINMAMGTKASVLAVEVTGLNEFITYPFKNSISRSGRNIEFVELKARGGTGSINKADRIKALVPFYRQGLIYHNKTICGPLEMQLLSYPRAKYWDVMDCFAYVVELLEMGTRYMFPEAVRSIEDEFKDLDYDDPLDSSWRCI